MASLEYFLSFFITILRLLLGNTRFRVDLLELKFFIISA